MKFKMEREEECSIQFLDIKIKRKKEKGIIYLRWKYKERTKKTLLTAASNHSGIIKTRIIKNAIKNAMKKSCVHEKEEAMNRQIVRLTRSGYWKEQIEVAVAKRSCSVEKRMRRGKSQKEKWLYSHMHLLIVTI